MLRAVSPLKESRDEQATQPTERCRKLIVLIPIKTDTPVRGVPRANHLMIAANVAVYLLTNLVPLITHGNLGQLIKGRFALTLIDPHLYQFITYQFLHGDFWHILFNMLFLWVFGNAVNAKMGNIVYTLFYLAGGVFAAVGFSYVSDGASLIGASGAISAVTMAFLVLFPRCTVTVFYWLWLFIGTLHIQAMLLIGIKIVLWDNIIGPRLASGGTDVAYSAHISGYIFGFVLGMFLLLIRALPRDQFDMLAVWKRYYQRQQLRAAMSDPNARARAQFGTVARPVDPASGRPLPESPRFDDATMRLRAEIGELLARHDYDTAAERYQTLAAGDPTQCLPRSQMLLVANQLMTMQRHPQAAAAYERFLKAYPTGGDVLQIKLLLGIIYARYLQQYERAKQYLGECATRLTDPEQLQQARQWLDVISASEGGKPQPGTG